MKNTWSNVTAAYTVHLQAAGRAKGTIKIHLYYINLFRRCAPAPGIVRAEQLEHFLANPKWSPETRKSARSVARTFFLWCFEQGIIPVDPAEKLPSVKIPEATPRPCPERIFRQALANADYRTRLMLRFGAFAGLRACEIAKVAGRDFDGQVLHVTGKGGRRRIVPILDPTLREVLRENPYYLFPSPIGGHMTAGHVSKLISRALPDGWTAHTLRHRFGTSAYAGTRDILAVQKLLGHSSPATTQRYVATPLETLLAAVESAA